MPRLFVRVLPQTAAKREERQGMGVRQGQKKLSLQGRESQNALLLTYAGLALCISLLFTGCNNQLSKFRDLNALQGGASPILPEDEDAAIKITLGQVGSFTEVSRELVFPSSSSPTPPKTWNVFEIVGDGSGSLSGACENADKKTENQACTCEVVWEESDGTTRTIETPTRYVDQNILKCDNPIPDTSTAGVARVRIKINTVGLRSNTLTISIGSGVADAQAYQYMEQFAAVLRYQCAPHTLLPYAFDHRIYDPIQSEDPRHLTYINFYTSNPGRAIVRWMQSHSSKTLSSSRIDPSTPDPDTWRCPRMQGFMDYVAGSGTGAENPLKYPPLNSSLRKDQWVKHYNHWLNEVLFNHYSDFSKGTVSSVEVLFDPRPQDVRWNAQADAQIANNKTQIFYLAKNMSFGANTYQVPVSAMEYPSLQSPDPAQPGQPVTLQDPIRRLGFGVASFGADTGEEVCPDSPSHPAYGKIYKPEELEWAKLWQFRASLSPRQTITSPAVENQFINTNLGTVLCNPGTWKEAPSAGDAVFPDCSMNYRAPAAALPAPQVGICSISPNILQKWTPNTEIRVQFNCRPSDINQQVSLRIADDTKSASSDLDADKFYCLNGSNGTDLVIESSGSPESCGCMVRCTPTREGVVAQLSPNSKVFITKPGVTPLPKVREQLQGGWAYASHFFVEPTPVTMPDPPYNAPPYNDWSNRNAYHDLYYSGTSGSRYEKLKIIPYENQLPQPTPTPRPDYTRVNASLEDFAGTCFNRSSLADRVILNGNNNLCIGYQSPSGITPHLNGGSPSSIPLAALDPDVQAVLDGSMEGLTLANFPYHKNRYIAGAPRVSGPSCSLPALGRAGFLRFSDNVFDPFRGADYAWGSNSNTPGEGNGTDRYFRIGEYVKSAQLSPANRSFLGKTDVFRLPGSFDSSGTWSGKNTDEKKPILCQTSLNGASVPCPILSPHPTKTPNLLTRDRMGWIGDTNVQLKAIDPTAFGSYVFVTTPTSVRSDDILNESSPIAQKYTPWGLRSKEACLFQAKAPIDLSTKDLYLEQISRSIKIDACQVVKYSPFFNSADNNPNDWDTQPISGNPSRTRVYPVCVLRPKKVD